MVAYKSLATLASINFDCYTIVVDVWILATTILLGCVCTKKTPNGFHYDVAVYQNF